MIWGRKEKSGSVEITAVIRNQAGIHCRPTAAIVKAARQFDDDIVVIAPDGQTADPKSAIELLSMGLDHGSEVCIQVSGDNAGTCANRMKELFETEFDFPPKD